MSFSDIDKLLTINEVADILIYKKQKVYKLIKEGKLAAFKPNAYKNYNKGSWRIRGQDLLSFIAERSQGANSKK